MIREDIIKRVKICSNWFPMSKVENGSGSSPNSPAVGGKFSMCPVSGDVSMY